jgi:S-adenosylmethionine synthetase
MVNIHSRGRVSERQIEEAVRKIFRLTPKGMIEMLDLRRPIYQKTAAYGHFGRELPEFTWERTDKVQELRSYFGYESLDARRQ